MKKFLVALVLMLGAAVKAHAVTSTVSPVALPYAIVISSISNAAAAPVVASATLPGNVGAYSTGYFDYITHVRIEMYATSTLTGGATPVTCTTTNLGGVAFKLPTAAATGTTTVFDEELTNALQGTQGNAVTVTCPGTANVIWNVTVGYYTAP